ncbi:MAG: hypothetical protein NC401_15270 [Ruminococcus sp.]|nr:hypothetical protein [Ruminococcus sp.]
MTENLLNDTPITLELLREQFRKNDFSTMPVKETRPSTAKRNYGSTKKF